MRMQHTHTHRTTEQGRRWPQQTGFHHLYPRVICFLRFAFRSVSPSYTFIPTHQTKREVTWREQPKPGYPSAVTTPSLGWGDGFCKTQLTDRRRGGMKKPTAKNASLRSMQRVCVCVCVCLEIFPFRVVHVSAFYLSLTHTRSITSPFCRRKSTHRHAFLGGNKIRCKPIYEDADKSAVWCVWVCV